MATKLDTVHIDYDTKLGTRTIEVLLPFPDSKDTRHVSIIHDENTGEVYVGLIVEDDEAQSLVTFTFDRAGKLTSQETDIIEITNEETEARIFDELVDMVKGKDSE